VNRPFQDGKRVLITGHAGFKDAWLALWRRTRNARVVGYSLPPPTPSLFADADVRIADLSLGRIAGCMQRVAA